MRGVREDRLELGSSAHVPDVRRHALLRLLAESPRVEAREGKQPSGHRVGGAGRALDVLLPGRGVRRILISAGTLCTITSFESGRANTIPPRGTDVSPLTRATSRVISRLSGPQIVRTLRSRMPWSIH